MLVAYNIPASTMVPALVSEDELHCFMGLDSTPWHPIVVACVVHYVYSR